MIVGVSFLGFILDGTVPALLIPLASHKLWTITIPQIFDKITINLCFTLIFAQNAKTNLR